MSPRDPLLRIWDILNSIKKILRYVEEKDIEGFKQDPMLVDAVVRNFITIGEAAARLPGNIKDRNTDIPWRLMRDMRNFVTHTYWDVDLDIVWKTIHNRLPPLIKPLEDLLGDSNPDQQSIP
jgi:uncharacterized protein with HEPN domain